MSETDLEARLDAVERALTDGDASLADVRDAAARTEGIERLEARVDELESTVEEVEAAVQAIRGYTGNVRAVNRDVERRASAALAKVEALESALDGRPELAPDDADGLSHPANRPTEFDADRSRDRDVEPPRPSETVEANERRLDDRSTMADRRDSAVEVNRAAASAGQTSESTPTAPERTDSSDAAEERREDDPTLDPERVDAEHRDASVLGGERGSDDPFGAGGRDPVDDDTADRTRRFVERVRDAL